MRWSLVVMCSLSLGLGSAPLVDAWAESSPANGPSSQASGLAATPTGDASATAAMRELALNIQRSTLDNGLRVVLNVDRSAPTVAVSVTYDVGSRNEIPGRSGFAHLFEHIMFQGSRHVAKGEHFKLIAARGGTLNGTTSTDRTNYYEVLPASELELALWLEADRMHWLDVTRENFENQRQVVQEEYRMRVANAAYRPALIRQQELVYGSYWPYAHPTIGSMADLDAAQFDWVVAFHERYYSPSNAVVAISGDFDSDQAMRWVREYFGAIPAKAARSAFESPPPPVPPARPTVEQVTDRNAKTPAFIQGWLIPDTLSPEHYALELATMVLTDGESSRLHQSLVRQGSVAQEVSSWTYDRRGPDNLTLMAVLNERGDPTAVRKLVENEISALGRVGPSEAELERAKNRVRSYFLFDLQSSETRAKRLGEYEVFWGDARQLTRQLDGYLSVTAKDVQAAVARYLAPEHTVVVEVQPAASSESEPSAPSKSAPSKEVAR